MKTRQVLTRVLFAVASVITLTHCGSSGSNNNQPAATSSYYISGNNCLNSAGQVVGLASTCPVSGQNCGVGAYGNTGYNTGYTGYNNNTGYNNTGYNPGYSGTGYNTGYTGASNCGVNTPSGYGPTGYSQPCYGTYVYQGQIGQCTGQCHGPGFLTYPSYQQVTCQ